MNNKLTQLITKILEILGFKDRRVPILSERITQEIFDNLLIELLDEDTQNKLKILLNQQQYKEVQEILKGIPEDVFGKALIQHTKKVIYDSFKDLIPSLNPEEAEVFEKRLEKASEIIKIQLKTIGSANEVLQNLSKK